MKEHFSIISFAGGFLVGALCVGFWAGSHGTLPPSVSTVATSTATTTDGWTAPPNESGAVSVTDQAPGTSVTVESVTVPPPGVWVAVREVSNATLGNVLGAARVTGPRSAVVIPLLRATAPGSSYAIELYRDNGDETFNLSTDSVYVDFSTSEPVIAYFQTTNDIPTE